MAKITRNEEIISMMKRKSGATTAQISERTGMQEHSARALISRLEIQVTKTKNGKGVTVYSIPSESEAAA
jgi:arginine repressor